MRLTELAFQCVDAIREADYPHQTQGPDAMLDCIDMDAAYAGQMLDAYEKEHDDALTELARLTARVAELEAERRWVSVEERLPETGSDLLAYSDADGCCWTAYATDDEDYPIVDDLRHLPIQRVTHWMPLPAPPEGTP